MDAETRAVAVRLRAAMWTHGALWTEGMVLVDGDGNRYMRAGHSWAWLRELKRAIWAPPPPDAIPDIDAAAVWGLMIGMLRHAQSSAVLWDDGDTCCAGALVEAEAYDWPSQGGPCYEPVVRASRKSRERAAEHKTPGVALALALLAAWGEP